MQISRTADIVASDIRLLRDRRFGNRSQHVFINLIKSTCNEALYERARCFEPHWTFSCPDIPILDQFVYHVYLNHAYRISTLFRTANRSISFRETSFPLGYLDSIIIYSGFFNIYPPICFLFHLAIYCLLFCRSEVPFHLQPASSKSSERGLGLLCYLGCTLDPWTPHWEQSSLPKTFPILWLNTELV